MKMRAVLLGVLALLIISGTMTSIASASGPYWHTKSGRLEKGTLQIKLQLKGSAVLSAPNLDGLEVECKTSISEGATIEGNGTLQGQAKGRVTYSSCQVIDPSGCKVAEPITTVPLKSYLAEHEGAQQNIVQVFEPTEGLVFVNLKFSGSSCGAIAGTQPVDGSVYGELVPKEALVQEGLLNFPASPVEKVKHEGTEKEVGLKVGGQHGVFKGAYGTRLATFPELFGAFLT